MSPFVAPFTLVLAGEPGETPMPAVATAAGPVWLLTDLVAHDDRAVPATARARVGSSSWVPLLGHAADLVDALRVVLPGPKADALREPRLVPVLHPGKVLAVGRNYAEHARELGNDTPAAPVLFGKLSDCVVGHGDAIEIPADLDGEVHHEAELAVVIGQVGRRIAAADAMRHVAGYACANDVTARTLQKSLQERRLPWFAGKNLDTFLPLGPGIVPAGLIDDPHGLEVTCRVDGEVRQQGSTAQMVHRIADLVAWASRHLTLRPGDVILTGTPAGVGMLRAGQRVQVSIAGVGVLENPVVAVE